MTDEQIVEALECCVRYENHMACRGCPFSGGICEEDGLALQKHSLALIKRQQAEIEALKKAGNKIYSLGLVAALMDQRERLVRAEYEREREIRAEAIREFAEKLKEAFPQTDRNNICPALYYDDYCYIIDELAEEMTEEKK